LGALFFGGLLVLPLLGASFDAIDLPERNFILLYSKNIKMHTS
jgi:hypothetical protein